MFHGRWDATASVAHYVQLGFAALATAQMPDSTARRCQLVTSLLPPLLAVAPNSGAPLSRQ
eukprot:1020944-Lingulodinium_polyedra.AAC.1